MSHPCGERHRYCMAAVAKRSDPKARMSPAAEIADLFERTQRPLGLFLARMVRDPSLADDLLQDTFHDAIRSAGDLSDVKNAEAWLFGIARNRALSALRRRRRFAKAIERMRPHARAMPEAADVVAVRDLLEQHLTPDERALLVLRFLHGFDSTELGVIFGCSGEAARQRIARARAKLLRAAEDELQQKEA
jgi:RNA polymerase sigma-70 factor (ECF subfamily)